MKKRTLSNNQGKKMLNLTIELRKKMSKNITKKRKELFRKKNNKITNLYTKSYHRIITSQKNTCLNQSTNMKTSMRTNSRKSMTKKKFKEQWAQEWEYIRNTSQHSQSSKFTTNLNMSMSNLKVILSIKEKSSRSAMKLLIRSSIFNLNIKIFLKKLIIWLKMHQSNTLKCQ